MWARTHFVTQRVIVAVVNPERDRARLCQGGHPSCIEGFVPSATGEHVGLAGWWHFEWDQGASQWNITDPTGGTRYVIVQLADAGYPPAALINAVPGLSFEPIVVAIRDEGALSPRLPHSTPRK